LLIGIESFGAFLILYKSVNIQFKNKYLFIAPLFGAPPLSSAAAGGVEVDGC
jgi:hypothetical protein